MADLRVELEGVTFPNPIIVTACSLTATLDGILQLAEAGAGGIVTKTISQHLLPAQSTNYLEHNGQQFVGSDQRVQLKDGVVMISAAKEQTDIPIIANLIAYSDDVEQWIELAQAVEAAGADFVEIDLNCHITADQSVPGSAEASMFQAPSIGQDPDMTATVVRAVKSHVKVPVITKLTPSAGDLIGIAKAAVESDTDVLSLLNALGGLPGLDINNGGRPLYSGMKMQGGSAVMGDPVNPLALWYTGVLRKLFDTPIISGGGVMSGEHAIERILLGASLAGMCAAIYRDGPTVITAAVSRIQQYLEEFEYESTEAFRGAGQQYFGRSPYWAFSGVTS